MIEITPNDITPNKNNAYNTKEFDAFLNGYANGSGETIENIMSGEENDIVFHLFDK
jgi:hypothetical protein